MFPIESRALAIALLAAALYLPAHAQTDMTIYRCVDPSGAVTLQNDVPCPKGSQQSVRKVGVLPTMPAPVAAPPAKPAPAAATPPPSTPPPPAPAVPLARTAPPPLFQCRTWDDRDYLGDTAEPPATCVPVQAMGIDGTSASAAGASCEMRRDVCTAVPADKLGTGWKKRVDEAEFRWKVGGGRDDDRKAEFDRLSKTYRDTTCVP
ncbi:MAG: hypothetical protein V4673_13930 [Pseudomonadota bacterium]